jgi:hypothetical protein
MASLLHDIRRGASPETEADQQMMHVGQRRHGYPRCAEVELRAGGGIEHPSSHNSDDAGSNLDVNHLAVRTPLAVMPPQTPAVQRVPAVMNDHLSPDMGRMDP